MSNSTTTLVSLALGIWGAVLSSVLAVRQLMLDRRGLHIKAQVIAYAGNAGDTWEVLEVRALNVRKRPVHVRQAGVVMEGGGVFHPSPVRPSGLDPPRQPMLNDGESVSFYFDLLSFEKPGYLPKAVWVQDFGDTRYERRVRKKQRQKMKATIRSLRSRIGDEYSDQESLNKERQAERISANVAAIESELEKLRPSRPPED